MSKRVVIFNHKGGVSKTTSAYNIGWTLSRNHKVLLVDADPQCNLSSLILRDEFESYYLNEGTKKQNIKDGISPAFQGKPEPIEALTCYTPQRSSSLYLLAGHADLSAYDAALSFAQTSNNAISTLQNLPGAFSKLIKLTEEKYSIDYTIIDLNPSLSAINQNLFLVSDSFIIPTNPDPFSLMAIETLTSVLPRWVKWKESAVPMFEGSAYPLTIGTPKFIGTLIQRFNIRNGRAAKPYRDNIEEIKNKISTDFLSSINKVGMTLSEDQYGSLRTNRYCLKDIPDFQGLLPKSNDIGVPVFAIQDDEISETGPIRQGMIEKRDTFKTMFDEISLEVVRLLEYV
jgi:cellulose biosynthesis protein BcsQ